MLDSIRKQGASAFIYLIFGLLIAIFIVNMGNGSGKQGGGCAGTSNVSLTVDGKTVNHTSYLVAFSSYRREGQTTKQRQFIALERLIRRELLAREAEKHGLRVSSDLVEDEIKKGNFFMAGERVPLGGNVFDEHDDGEQTWNFKKFKNWVSELNVSMTSYQDEQQRELQAVLMADLVKSSVKVSRDEAQKAWLYEHSTVTYDVVAFSPASYEAAIRLTEADAARFLALHEDDVKARFKQDERLYNDEKRPLQYRLRQIFIAKADATPAPTRATADTHALPIEEAKAKLESVRASASSDKTKFTAAAKDLSTDDVARAMGGAIGWHDASDPQLTEKPITDAVKALKVGDMTPVIATDKGVYLVLAEESRQGKLTYDQVKLDIALDLAKHTWSKEKAKRDAIAALETARAGTGKNLDQMFDKEVEPSGPPPGGGFDMKQLDNLPPEQRQKILEMLQNAGKHGAIDFVTKDHLASWDSDGSSGGGSGSAAGSGSGTGSGTGTGTVKETKPEAPEIVASKDDLPAFAEVAKPKAVRPPPGPRSSHMTGLGASKDAAKALFDELKPGMLGKRVYETEGNFVIMQLISKQDADPKEFDKRADKEVEDLREARAQLALESWLKERCEELVKDDKIKPADDIVRESDESGKPVQSSYRPCFTFR